MGKDSFFKIENDRILLSTATMQKAFGVTRQALSSWGDNGCPKYGRGWWDLSEVINWKSERDIGIVKKEMDMSDKERKLLYEADLKKAQAEAAEFKNAVTRGDYLEKVQIIQDLSRFFSVFKQAAIGIPRKVATEISPFVDTEQARAVEERLTDIIRQILEEFSCGKFE